MRRWQRKPGRDPPDFRGRDPSRLDATPRVFLGATPSTLFIQNLSGRPRFEYLAIPLERAESCAFLNVSFVHVAHSFENLTCNPSERTTKNGPEHAWPQLNVGFLSVSGVQIHFFIRLG